MSGKIHYTYAYGIGDGGQDEVTTIWMKEGGTAVETTTPTTSSVITVELMLSGGHAVRGKLTTRQFDTLMGQLWHPCANRQGYLRMDELDTDLEVAIAYCAIVAVRYNKDA